MFTSSSLNKGSDLLSADLVVQLVDKSPSHVHLVVSCHVAVEVVQKHELKTIRHIVGCGVCVGFRQTTPKHAEAFMHNS